MKLCDPCRIANAYRRESQYLRSVHMREQASASDQEVLYFEQQCRCDPRKGRQHVISLKDHQKDSVST